jgi:hypothetical protein
MSKNPDKTLHSTLATMGEPQAVPASAAINRKVDESTYHQLLRGSSFANRLVADTSSNPVLA